LLLTTADSAGSLSIGTNFSISIDGESKEQCDKLFSKLTEGGEATMPLQETFWGSYFGMCRDRFDINWMVSFETGDAQS
jgi:PhnB protein